MSESAENTLGYVRHVMSVMGLSATALAEQAKISSTTLTRPLNNPDHKFTISNSTIGKIEAVSGISYASYLATKSEGSGANLKLLATGSSLPVRVIGKVAAGIFREVDETDQSERRRILEVSDERFPNARRMAFEVEGDSMNQLEPRPILAGDTLICVAFEDVAKQVKIRDGMVVVVERTRDGGHTREWSVKQVELYEDRIEFHPRSSNPAHKPIVVQRDASADVGVRVEIIGLVRRATSEFPL